MITNCRDGKQFYKATQSDETSQNISKVINIYFDSYSRHRERKKEFDNRDLTSKDLRAWYQKPFFFNISDRKIAHMKSLPNDVNMLWYFMNLQGCRRWFLRVQNHLHPWIQHKVIKLSDIIRKVMGWRIIISHDERGTTHNMNIPNEFITFGGLLSTIKHFFPMEIRLWKLCGKILVLLLLLLLSDIIIYEMDICFDYVGLCRGKHRYLCSVWNKAESWGWRILWTALERCIGIGDLGMRNARQLIKYSFMFPIRLQCSNYMLQHFLDNLLGENIFKIRGKMHLSYEQNFY